MKKSILPLLICLLATVPLAAKDAEAVKVYEQGYKAYQARKYYDAAGLFVEAGILADSPTIKANALRGQIGAWRMCEMPYREFKAIEALLTHYPDYANFQELVEREYELGTGYYRGTREPAYWQLRWIPLLTDDNKCAEIYAAALKRAPFLSQAPAARLRLAHLLDEEGKTKASLEQYRLILKDYPESRECRYAMLALANGLLILAERGDGDGQLLAEACEVMLKFRKTYPKAPENAWVDRHLLLYQDAQGKRLLDMAQYYDQNGRTDAARRYLAQILRDYPESESAQSAEKMLMKLDATFIPGDFVQEKGSRLPRLKTYALPEDAERILITPPGEKNHYLIPVPDLSLPREPFEKEEENE